MGLKLHRVKALPKVLQIANFSQKLIHLLLGELSLGEVSILLEINRIYSF